MIKETILVTGMSCSHCVKAVTEAISALPGIKKTDVSLKKNRVVVKFNEETTSLDSIKKAIREAGYEAE